MTKEKEDFFKTRVEKEFLYSIMEFWTLQYSKVYRKYFNEKE